MNISILQYGYIIQLSHFCTPLESSPTVPTESFWIQKSNSLSFHPQERLMQHGRILFWGYGCGAKLVTLYIYTYIYIGILSYYSANQNIWERSSVQKLRMLPRSCYSPLEGLHLSVIGGLIPIPTICVRWFWRLFGTRKVHSFINQHR
jgi:hypothetical protein